MIQLALALALQSAKPIDFPPGINSSVWGVMYALENSLAKGDFASAQKMADLLPKRTIRVKYDDSAVPSDQKSDFRSAYDAALKQWSQTGLKFEPSSSDDIGFSFVDSIPKPAGELMPPGASFDWQLGPERLQVKLALHRLDTQEETLAADIHNEVAYAIGQYLGLTRVPRFFSFNSRSDQNTPQNLVLSPYEADFTKGMVGLADQLREQVASKTKVEEKWPSMALETNEITGVKGTQDSPLQLSFKVENKGDADLRLYVLPDCSCLMPEAPPVIHPHESGNIVAAVNTSAYTGKLNHSLLIYTNDPQWPLDEVPVKINVTPLYRFVHEGSDNIFVGPNGGDFDVYLILNKKLKAEPLTASIDGPNAKVQFHAWSGNLAFDKDAEGQPESGYKFHVHVAAGAGSGIIPATLQIGTDSEAYQELTYTFNLQAGIAADPGQLYMGMLSSRARKSSLLISRPNVPFKIESLKTDDPNFTAKVVSLGQETEYRVDVFYNGKGTPGPLSDTLTVFTNDKTQPVIKVPIVGSVK